MIAVDTNLLIHAHRRDSPWHESAVGCIRDLAQSPAPWGIPWPCAHEFLSIVTHMRVYSPPSTLAEALGQLRAWQESPSLVILSEQPGYFDILQRLLERAKAAGPMVHDARIAALCLHHGVRELWTADRDFSRFGELRSRNPLTGP